MGKNTSSPELSKLLQERDNLTKKIDAIDFAISIIQNQTSSSFKSSSVVEGKANLRLSSNDYDPNWSMTKKALFILKKNRRFMHNREISEIAHNYEPDKSVEDFISQFSRALFRLSKEENRPVTNVKPDSNRRNTFWGSPKWQNEDGSIKEVKNYKDGELVE